VEVKLQQFMDDAVNTQLATGGSVDLDGVPVVDQFQWAFFVVGAHHHA